MADFLRNLLTFKYFRSKDCCSNGAHRERVCKFWSKQEWEADKSSSKSSSLHAPQSRYQELEVALDSSSATINQLNENVESLRIGELEQAPSAVSMQQQEEDRNSENKSALQLEQQVKELQEKQLSEEMKEDIWTLRRRRCLSPCQASWRTWRAGRPWSRHQRVPSLTLSAQIQRRGHVSTQYGSHLRDKRRGLRMKPTLLVLCSWIPQPPEL
ncbi:uncharacterized protein isoform X11 [Macaca fascicularis]|uniref:uncharacterized protein isoform X11 n=1 Tax=Macaca fascicularis TaxID=9541 RepID=UPI0032B03951